LTTIAINNDFALYNNGGTSSYNLYIPWASGNVLIGTTTDSGYKLDVNGTGRFSGDVAVNSATVSINSSSYPKLRLNDTNSGGGIYYWQSIVGSFRLVDEVAGAARFLINSSGQATFYNSLTANQISSIVTSGTARVTIGDDLVSGGALLNLRGLSGGKTWFISSNYNIGGGLEFIQSTTNGGTTPASTSIFSLSSTGAATFSSSVTAGGIVQAGSYFYNSFSTAGVYNAYFQNTSATGYGLFSQGGSSGRNAVTIKSYGGTDYLVIDGGTGAATFSSSVTAGNAILNESSYLLKLGNSSSINNASIALFNNGGQNLDVLYAAAGKTTFHHGVNISANAFYIGRDGTYDLVVNNSGNVGIGTTSPTAGLEILTDAGTTNALRVSSSRAISLGTDVGISFRYLYDTTNYTTGGLIVVAKDNTTRGNQSGNFQFYTNNAGTASERMRITSGGQVIIGGTSIRSELGSNTKLSIGGGSIGSVQVSGAGALDLGISLDQFNAGLTLLFLASRNTSNGTSTASAVYIINFYYDGGNLPSITYIGGTNNFVSFGSSGGKLTATNPGSGNAAYSWFTTR